MILLEIRLEWGMNNFDRNSQLDHYLDYIRHVILTITGALAAYASLVLAETVLLPWALLVMLAAVIYTLFLPYKKSTTISGEWGLVSRIKAIDIVVLGLPAYAIPSLLIIADESIVQAFIEFSEGVLSLSPDVLQHEFVELLIMILIGTSIASALISRVGAWRILQNRGYGTKEIKEIVWYAAEDRARDSALISLVISFIVLNLSAGWFQQNIPGRATIYFGNAFWLVLILVIFCWFFVAYTPSLCNIPQRRILESILILAIAASLPYPQTAFILSVIAMGGLWFLNNNRRKEISVENHIASKKTAAKREREQREKKLMEDHFVVYLFYKLYPRAERIIIIVALITLLTPAALFFIGFQIGLDYFPLLLLPGAIYYGVPYIWLVLFGDSDQVLRRIDDIRQ